MDFKKCSNFEKNVRFFISQIWFYLLKFALKDTHAKKETQKHTTEFI